MIPEGLDFDPESNSSANAAGASAVVLKDSGASVVDLMMLSNQRVDDWAKQKQAQQAAQNKKLGEMFKDIKLDSKDILDKDAPVFVAGKKAMEDMYTNALMQGNDPDNPRFLQDYNMANKKKRELETWQEASAMHKTQLLAAEKELSEDGKGDKPRRYNFDKSMEAMRKFKEAPLEERSKTEFQLLVPEDWDLDNYVRNDLLKPDAKSGVNKFQEVTSEVVHDKEKGADYIKEKQTYGKDLAGERQYEYKEDNGKFSRKLIDDPKDDWHPITKTTYDFETKRTGVQYDKFVTPEHVYDAAEYAMNSNPKFRDRVLGEWQDILKNQPAGAQQYIDAAASKSEKTGRIITPETLYAAQMYIVPVAQEKELSKDLRMNAGDMAFRKESAALYGKMEASKMVISGILSQAKALFSGEDEMLDVGANGTKKGLAFTLQQFGPRAKAGVIDNPIQQIIHTTSSDGKPMLLIQTPRSVAAGKANIANMTIPIRTELEAMGKEMETATPQRKAVLQQLMANKQQELEKIAKMPGSGYQAITDLGQLINGLVVGEPAYGKDAGLMITMAQEIGKQNKWFDAKSGTWSGVGLAKGQNYKNLTLEQSKARMLEVDAKMAENEAKYKALGNYTEYSNPKSASYDARKASIADAVMAENKALIKEKGELVKTVGVNAAAPKKTFTLADVKAANPNFKGTDAELIQKYKAKGYEVK